MRRLLCFLIIVLPISVYAQAEDEMEAIVRLTGKVNHEELTAYEVEHLSDLFNNPLKINLSTVSELEKVGIFTPFQIASLSDYRMRHGDVLSITELGMLDGFHPETAKALSPFLSFESLSNAGITMDKVAEVRQDLYVKGGCRQDENGYMYGLKYRMESSRLSLSLSCSKPYTDDTSYSGNLSWDYGKGRFLIGDFNARFGQGLCLWSSAVIGGLTSPSSFMRKPSGLSPSFSFTGNSALTGVAAEVSFGKVMASFFLAAPGVKAISEKPDDLRLMPVVNISSYGKSGVLSFTHRMEFCNLFNASDSFRIPCMKSSADASICVRGVNLFAEASFDWVFSDIGAVLGTDFRAGENLRLATLLKYCPPESFTNEYVAAISGEFKGGQWVRMSGAEGFGSSVRRCSGVFSIESSYHPESKSKENSESLQLKAQVDGDFMAFDWLKLGLKVSERLRTWGEFNRTEVRVDLQYLSARVFSTLRLDVVKCVSSGILGYAEAGYKSSTLSLYLRAGMFKVDNWDDRIYVYERDAPGSFNVPAYYGRGYWSAFTGAWNYARWGKLYLRVSYIGYDFMPQEERKPGRAELKLQTVFRF